MARMINIVSGTNFIRLPMASPCNSPSPTQRMRYPSGRSIDSISSLIDSTTLAGVASSQ